MTEEENHIDNSEDWVELQIKHQDSTLSTRGTDWSEVIARAAIGDIKFRVSKVANHAAAYNPKSKRIIIVFKESIGQIKVRIALALLFTFPKRISRQELVLMSDIKPARIREYLTNPDKGVTEYIDENDSGIVLDMKGFDWAVEILNTTEEATPKLLRNGDTTNEQSTKTSEDTTK